jgi:hypothetical protein
MSHFGLAFLPTSSPHGSIHGVFTRSDKYRHGFNSDQLFCHPELVQLGHSYRVSRHITEPFCPVESLTVPQSGPPSLEDLVVLCTLVFTFTLFRAAARPSCARCSNFGRTFVRASEFNVSLLTLKTAMSLLGVSPFRSYAPFWGTAYFTTPPCVVQHAAATDSPTQVVKDIQRSVSISPKRRVDGFNRVTCSPIS